jgi:hypothetical protein
MLLLILISVSVYFFFSFERRSAVVERVAGLGSWLMMIGFGAMFGSTVVV